MNISVLALTIAHLDHMFVLVVKVEADVATITVKKIEDRDAELQSNIFCCCPLHEPMETHCV